MFINVSGKRRFICFSIISDAWFDWDIQGAVAFTHVPGDERHSSNKNI